MNVSQVYGNIIYTSAYVSLTSVNCACEKQKAAVGTYYSMSIRARDRVGCLNGCTSSCRLSMATARLHRIPPIPEQLLPSLVTVGPPGHPLQLLLGRFGCPIQTYIVCLTNVSRSKPSEILFIVDLVGGEFFGMQCQGCML